MASDPSIALQSVVDRFLLHSKLSVEAQSAILHLPANVVLVNARREVVQNLDDVRYCNFVISGLIARYRQISNGNRQITAFLLPQDLSDFHSVARPAGFGGLYAITDSVVIRIPHTEILKVAQTLKPIGDALWRESMMDLALLTEWVVNLGRRDAKARTAHLLCEMAVRFNHRHLPALSYDFPITQSDLACAVGMTGVHLNRVLADLRNAHVLSMKNGQVRILDWRALASLGDFDAGYMRSVLSA